MRFSLNPELLARLRAVQPGGHALDELETREEAFLLDRSLGQVCYLTSEGRVLIDARDWDDTGVREATDDEAVAAIVLGAEKTEVGELLHLLPAAPPAASLCDQCNGWRWFPLGLWFSPPTGLHVVCVRCWGRGWTSGEAAL
jgi:hypothetical protein